MYDTIPSYRINYLPDKNNDNLLRPTNSNLMKQSIYEEIKPNSIETLTINGTNRRWNYSMIC